MRLLNQMLNLSLFQSLIQQSRIQFETVKFSWFRQPISKQLPLELNQARENRQLSWVIITVSSYNKNSS